MAGLAGLAAGTGWLPAAGAAPVRPGAPAALTVDGWPRAVGVDPDDVRFAWHVTDPRPGAIQSAYRLTVTRGGATVWDSGRVTSSDQSDVSFGGPVLQPDTEYRWTVQTYDGRGQASPGAVSTFTTALRDHDWQAQWITRTATDPVDAGDEYTYTRKEFPLAASPITRATAYVSADQQYELRINGAQAGKGPAISYPDTQAYESLDVTGLLHPGRTNAVGLLFRWYGIGKGRPGGEPGALLELSVSHADGTREVIGTDASWRVARGNWLASTPRNRQLDDIDTTENVSGLTEPVGWDQPGYHDALWQPPRVLGRPPIAPWTHLVPQQTHILTTPVTPVSITTLPTGAVVADFGRVIAAVPMVTFHAGVPGRLVTMRGGYLLDEPSAGQPVVGVPGQVSTTRGTQATDMSYSYVERAGAQTFRAFDYLGYRYFQIDDPGEKLQASDIVALARRNEVPDEHAATFSSSNPMVDAVFDLGRHSALYGSQEQFLDTPTREKSPFLRDGFNISETAMAAFGEANLTRRALLEFAQSQSRYWPDGRLNAVYPSGDGKRDIPDFTEIYPDWVWQYYLHTGDRGLLARVYPVVAAIGAYVARSVSPSTGLITNLAGGDDNPDYQYGIVDWPPDMRYGYDMATTARTTVNMLGVEVFRRLADIAAAVGRPASDSAAATARADSLTLAINRRLRRPDGIYIDGLHADGGQSRHASQHANAYALAYGVAPAADRSTLGAYVASLGMAMGPQTAQELLRALATTGRDGDLVTRLTDATTPGWANVLASGGTFTWETWTPSDANGDSMSHGWGSTVLVEIQDDLLGVTPTGPGFATFDVAPPLSGLDSASGTVPTPRGPISVRWRRQASGALSLDLNVPPNATASIRMPAPAARTSEPTTVVPPAAVPVLVRAGTHHFSSAGGSERLREVATPVHRSRGGRGVLVAVLVALVGAGGLGAVLLRRRRRVPAGPAR